MSLESNMLFTCPITQCQNKFRGQRELIFHMKTHHQKFDPKIDDTYIQKIADSELERIETALKNYRLSLMKKNKS